MPSGLSLGECGIPTVVNVWTDFPITLYVYTGRGPKRGPNMENSAYAFGEMHYLACVLWRRRPRPAQGTGTGPSGSDKCIGVVARWRCAGTVRYFRLVA